MVAGYIHWGYIEKKTKYKKIILKNILINFKCLLVVPVMLFETTL